MLDLLNPKVLHELLVSVADELTNGYDAVRQRVAELAAMEWTKDQTQFAAKWIGSKEKNGRRQMRHLFMSFAEELLDVMEDKDWKWQAAAVFEKYQDMLLGVTPGLREATNYYLWPGEVTTATKSTAVMTKEVSSSGGLAGQIFDPNEWNQALLNAMLPVMADAIAKGMVVQFKLMGIDVTDVKDCTQQIKAFCPTGQGGGVDPTCSPGQSGGGGGAFASQLNDGTFNWRKARISGTEEHSYLKGVVERVAKDTGVDLAFSQGYCAEVSVAIWDALGQPKDVVPYSAFFAEDEHVLLMSKKSKGIIDATGSQFDDYRIKVITDKDSAPYKRFKALSKSVIENARQDLKERLAKNEPVRHGADWARTEPNWKAFCPTGQGGGVDPTCSPGQSGGGGAVPTEGVINAIRAHSALGGPLASKYRATDEERVALHQWAKSGEVEETLYRWVAFKTDDAAWDAIQDGVEFNANTGHGLLASWSTQHDRAPLSGGAAHVKLISKGKVNGRKVAEWSIYPEENEVVTPSEGRFRVLSRERKGSIWYVEVEQIGMGADPAFVTSTLSKAFTKTAADILEMYDEGLLFDETISTSLGTAQIYHATDYPPWMKAKIKELLEESFQQDYWEKVNLTTLSDIDDFLIKNIREGVSIEQMAKDMEPMLSQSGRYARQRGRLIARTEAGHALNGARTFSMDTMISEMGEQLPMKKTWLSVLGTTTRDTHANLDGVPADKDGLWYLGGVQCRWPSDVRLPANERCNCQCTIVVAYGMQDAEAAELIQDYQTRLEAQGKSFFWSVNGNAILLRRKGGPGSGNFAHLGNAPHTGGSGPGSFPVIDNQGKYIPGNVGKSIGADTSKWPKSKQWALKKLATMEKLINDGDFDEVAKFPLYEGKVKNKFNDKVLAAQKQAKEFSLAATMKPVSGAKLTADPAVATSAGWKKIGGQLGTEKGGVYELDGKKYYVKTPDNPARAHNEVLAIKLYQAAGGKTVNAQLVEIDGKTAVATEWMEGSEKAKWNLSDKVDAAEDFALHAWLNNRDAVGAGFENPMDNIRRNPATDKMTLVDAGGSLNYSGMGGSGKKQFTDDAPEWEGLRDPNVNVSTAKAFGDMTPQQLISSGQKLKNITDDDINGLVDKFHGGDKFDKAMMKDTLRNRRDAIIEKVKLLEADHQHPITLGGSEPAKTSSPPAVPPPPALGPIKAKCDKMYAAAQAGDMAALDKIKTNPNATSPYPKKLHEYKMSVKASMQAGGKPSADHSLPKVTATKPVKVLLTIDELPPAPSLVGAHASANLKDKNALRKLALAGDLDGLHAMSPKSPKLEAYKGELISAVAEALNPPPPAVRLSESYIEAISNLPSAKQAPALKRVGYWAAMHEMGGVPAGTPSGVFPSSAEKAKLWKTGSAAFSKMTDQEVDDIRTYTSTHGFNGMNNALRKGAKDTHQKAYEKMAFSANKAILTKGHELPVGMKLSRKYRPTELEKHVKGLKPGTVISEKGMLSTSASSRVWSGTVHLKMTVGKGVKGIAAKNKSMHSSEDEVVLASNQRMMVTKVVKKPKWHEVHVTILPTTEDQCCPP